MIAFSMEMPTSQLSAWKDLVDLDFVLAHKVLEDKAYAEFFRERGARELILDNSMHELGKPLPIADLVRAARLCRATHVIAPDQLGQPEWNLEQFQATFKAFAREETTVAVALAGRTHEERQRYIRATRNASMLCLPYRENRVDWFFDHRHAIELLHTRVHLLGVSDLSELSHFERLSRSSEISWSVDTSKPVKWGLEGYSLVGLPSLRGAPISSKDLLDLSAVSPAQDACVRGNVQQLRSYLG